MGWKCRSSCSKLGLEVPMIGCILLHLIGCVTLIFSIRKDPLPIIMKPLLPTTYHMSKGIFISHISSNRNRGGPQDPMETARTIMLQPKVGEGSACWVVAGKISSQSSKPRIFQSLWKDCPSFNSTQRCSWLMQIDEIVLNDPPWKFPAKWSTHDPTIKRQTPHYEKATTFQLNKIRSTEIPQKWKRIAANPWGNQESQPIN